ncbi:hypothetical protein PMKS-003582 [Pichia membranifaciens]|uniref:protein-tyrosine-phosphatase n=1 Tax=Pichia membranifaciens TaxID=4926 RepID=A0A1Q2YKK0_9ASCO|nr:hypothetical protein PMKS-003582 [Pichia membranifaciens]
MGFTFGFTEDIEGEELQGGQQNGNGTPTEFVNPIDNARELQSPKLYTLQELQRLSFAETRITYEAVKLYPGRSLYRRELFDVRHQLMMEDSTFGKKEDGVSAEEFNILMGETGEDLKNGVYEGGLKSWECSFDMIAKLKDLQIDSTVPNSSSSLNTLKTPVLSRTPTPTGNLPAVGAAVSPFSNPRPLQHFRRMASFNSSSPSSSSGSSSVNGNSVKLNLSSGNSNGSTNTISNSNNDNNQRKRSATTLAINIPVHDVEAENDGDSPGTGHVPGGGLKSAYGDFSFNYDTDLPNDRNTSKTNSKKILVLPFEKPQKRTSSMDFSSQDSLSLSPISFSSPSISLSAKPLSSSFSAPVDLNSSGQSYSSEIKPQTIMHSFDESKMDKSNAETFKMAYPNGPICVLKPNLYLYSEPTFDEITDFDVIINVAQEIKDYTNQVDERNKIAEMAGTEDFDNISIDSQSREKLPFTNSRRNIEYYFIPWTHTSRLTSDFPYLTALIEKSLKNNKKVLIHCQCGVSRSASLIMAYFMKVFGGGYNEAYGRLKQIVPQISPNLSLIYELIEWGEWLEKGQPTQ